MSYTIRLTGFTLGVSILNVDLYACTGSLDDCTNNSGSCTGSLSGPDSSKYFPLIGYSNIPRSSLNGTYVVVPEGIKTIRVVPSNFNGKDGDPVICVECVENNGDYNNLTIRMPTTPTPTPTTTPTPTPSPTPIPTSTPTNTPNPCSFDANVVYGLPATLAPTAAPTNVPTSVPTNIPTNVPTNLPTNVPTNLPTNVPTAEPTNVPTATPTSLPPTPTPTLVYTTLNNVVSGTTLSEVCDGGATTPTLYFAGASIQIGESLYLNSNLTGPVPAGYYYYPDYNTVYNVTNGSTGAVASTPICPTATPTSTFLGWNFGTQLVENGPLAITLVDDPTTACSNPEYVIGNGTSNTVTWNFTVYGSNITDATAIVSLSSGFRAELTLNAIFYVRQRISGTFYYRRFQLNGSPGDTNVTASPTDVSFSC